jgi:hypothetical protein
MRVHDRVGLSGEVKLVKACQGEARREQTWQAELGLGRHARRGQDRVMRRLVRVVCQDRSKKSGHVRRSQERVGISGGVRRENSW